MSRTSETGGRVSGNDKTGIWVRRNGLGKVGLVGMDLKGATVWVLVLISD